MPRPPILAYAEPELISSVIDNTSVHSNIDKLLLENKMLRGNEEFYNNSLETDYGKPYKYKLTSPVDEYRTSVPLNMRHYADIMERANISKTFEEANIESPFSAAQYFESLPGVKVEDLQNSLLSKMKRGDAPGGIVGYYEPLKMAEDVKGKDALHQELAGALYTGARDVSAAPDTIRLYDNWKTYTSLLHEPLHGIRYPFQGKTIKLGHAKKPPVDQESFNRYEEKMMKNLFDFHGYPASKNEIINLIARDDKLKQQELGYRDESPKRETYVTDMLDRLLKGAPVKKQEGGPAERAPLLGYMNPAIQDETAYDSMDRLMFENELEQQPQHSMRTYQQGYDPAREWGEGMMPIGGALKLLKGSKEWPDLLKAMAQSSLRDKRKMEVMNHARNIFGKKMDAGGADEATRQYLESKWMERVIQ